MLRINPDSPDRKTRILDAAERCFVRAGFHRTTMQDIAAEAGMSAGNLYRYFPSKDAVVEGMSLRDRREMQADFEAIAGATDFMGAFVALGRKHFEEEPRDKAVLCLQIWAEAARSDAIGRIVADVEEDVAARLTGLLTNAQAAGSVSRAIDVGAVVALIDTLANGLMVRRAMDESFDAEREVGRVLKLVCAIVSGEVPAFTVDPDGEIKP